MNVLHVNMSLDPVNGGGTVERITKLSTALQEQPGINCRVLSIAAGQAPALPAEMCIMLPCWNARWLVPAPQFAMVRQAVAWADVVLLMNHWTLLNAWVYVLARRLNKPYAVCPAGALLVFGRSGYAKHLYNFLVGKAIVRNASAGIAITDDEFAYFSQYGLPASRIHLVPNGVNERDFRCREEKAFRMRYQLGIAPYILFVGRLNEIKGPDLLLQAFVQLAGTFPHHLVMVGPDGGMRRHLLNMAKDAGLLDRVHLIGYVGGDMKSSAYHGADMLVVSSRQEAMSIVALEAGICGTPVVLTDRCGFAALAEAGGALIVRAEAKALTAGIRSLLLDNKRRQKMGVKAKDHIAEHHTWDRMAIKLLDVYREMVREGRCAS